MEDTEESSQPLAIVSACRRIAVPDDSVPLQHDTQGIEVDMESATNAVQYVDQVGFVHLLQEDTAAIVRLQDMVDQGQLFVNLMYSSRSCGRAMPQVGRPPTGAHARAHVLSLTARLRLRRSRPTAPTRPMPTWPASICCAPR